MKTSILTAFLIPLYCLTAAAVVDPAVLTGAVQPLWPEGAPGATDTGFAHVPTLTVYLPEKDKATGTAIVVCPGGGYGTLALDHEGEQIAQWLIGEGIAAFVSDTAMRPTTATPYP